MMDSTRRFSNRVENYVAYRPGYPVAVIGLLQDECGLTEHSVVADVGSGPGALARLFLENGNRVFGVEPNAGMRAAGERLLGGYERFTSVPATAEATTLADESVDLVVAGQAFHWFEPVRTREEFVRILRPGGWVGLVWNERRKTGEPFLEAYERLLDTYGTDYADVGHRGKHAEIVAFFGDAGFETRAFDNAQVLDLQGLKGRALSSSYVPEEGEPGYEEMLGGLGRIFREHQESGRVVLRYDTRVYFGRPGS